MPARSATSRKWVAGAVRVARAAAFLTITTGVNGAVAAVWPRYEPIYAYLAAVVVVASLGSAMLGVTAAAVAVIVYDWMFAPVAVVPSFSITIPMAVAVLVTFATRALLPIWRHPALAPATEPRLLPSLRLVEPHITNVEVLADDRRIAELTRQLTIARTKYEDELHMRAGAETAAREQETEMLRELESLRAGIEEQRQRSMSNRRDYDEMREHLALMESRTEALQQRLETAQRTADEERARADRESALRAEVDLTARQSLQTTVADLTSRYEAALQEAEQRLESAISRFETSHAEPPREVRAAGASATGEGETTGSSSSAAELTARHESAIADAQKAAAAATATITSLQRELERAQAALSHEHARAERETRVRTQLEAAARGTAGAAEEKARLADESARRARREAEAALERAGQAEERESALSQQLEQVRSELTELRAGREKHQGAAVSAEQRASQAEERESALSQQLEQARSELTELRAGREKHQGAAVSAEQRAEALQRELDQLRGSTSGELRRAAEQQAALHDELEAVRRELDRAGNDRDQQTTAAAEFEQRASVLDRQLEELRQSSERAISEAAAAGLTLADELQAMTHRFEEADAERNQNRQALGASQNRTASLEAELEELRAASNRQLREAAENTSLLQGELDSVRRQLEEQSLREDLQTQAYDGMAAELTLLRQQLSALENERENLLTERQAAQEAFEEKLRTTVQGLESEHERVLAEAVRETEAAREQLRSESHRLNTEQAAVRQELQEQRQFAETQRDKASREFDEKLRRIVATIVAEHEDAIGGALVKEEAARADLRAASQRLQELQEELEAEKRERERGDSQWKSRMQSTVEELRQEHQAALQAATAQNEAAIIESRSLMTRIAALQGELEEERGKTAQLETSLRQESLSATAPVLNLSNTLPQRSQSSPALVLVVHSDAAMRTASREALQRSGYMVITAADGLEALRTATQEQPAAVLTEAIMPKMNARELVQRLRLSRETAGIRVVLLSSHPERPERGDDIRADEIVRDLGGAQAALNRLLTGPAAS